MVVRGVLLSLRPNPGPPIEARKHKRTTRVLSGEGAFPLGTWNPTTRGFQTQPEGLARSGSGTIQTQTRKQQTTTSEAPAHAATHSLQGALRFTKNTTRRSALGRGPVDLAPRCAVRPARSRREITPRRSRRARRGAHVASSEMRHRGAHVASSDMWHHGAHVASSEMRHSAHHSNVSNTYGRCCGRKGFGAAATTNIIIRGSLTRRKGGSERRRRQIGSFEDLSRVRAHRTTTEARRSSIVVRVRNPPYSVRHAARDARGEGAISREGVTGWKGEGGGRGPTAAGALKPDERARAATPFLYLVRRLEEQRQLLVRVAAGRALCSATRRRRTRFGWFRATVRTSCRVKTSSGGGRHGSSLLIPDGPMDVRAAPTLGGGVPSLRTARVMFET